MTNQQPARPLVGDGTPPVITLVRSTACHLCDEAHETLSRRALDREFTYEVHPATSSVGQELLARHCPAMFPMVLVDGAYFSAGRLPVRKLDRLLAERGAA